MIEQQLAEAWIEIARLIRERDFWKTSYEGLYYTYIAAQTRHQNLKDQYLKLKAQVQSTCFVACELRKSMEALHE